MTTVARMMELPSRPRVVLDIKGLLTHSYFSGKDPEPVRTDNGPVNTAGYGLDVFFNRYLTPILSGFAPLDIIAVWDGGNNYRKSLLPTYKAHRETDKEKENPAQAEELRKLQETAKRILANMGAINMFVEGVEADDVIALLVKQMPCNLMIYTVDADLLQLSSDRVIVSRRDVVEDEGEGYKGVPYSAIPLYKSIVGDSSDGYGGVKGLGPAAFAKLRELYGDEIMEELERIVSTKAWSELKEAAEDNNCKLLALLYESRTQWTLMYNLACLHPELCYQMQKGKKIEPLFYTRAPNAAVVKALLNTVKSPHLFDQIEQFFGSFELADNFNYDRLAEHLVANAGRSPVIAFDFETYDPLKHQPFVEALSDKAKEAGFVDVLSSIPTGGSFTYGDNLQHTIYIPERHKDTENVDDGVAAVLRYLVSDWGGPVVAHNSAFEEQVALQSYSVKFDRIVDTMIMSSYADENKRAGLKSLSPMVIDYKQTGYLELLQKHEAEDMRGLTGEQVLEYGCDDAFVTAHLWKLFDLVVSLEGSYTHFYTRETSVVHCLNRSFEAGINIDFDRMAELAAEDKATVTEGMAALRSLLEEHCQEENEAAANAFFEADEEYLKEKMREKGAKNNWGRDRIKAELEKTRLGYIGATQYRPLVVVKKQVDFKPTKAQLQKVIDTLQLRNAQGEGLVLKSASASAVTDLLIQASVESEAQDKFISLLGPAAKLLNKAVDHQDELAELVSFCAGVLSSNSADIVMGDELSLGSPKQMAELFYLKMGLPVRERTKKAKGSFRDSNGLPGSPSTDETAVAAALLFDCPEGDWRRTALKLILDIKEAMTRESLYYKPYPLWVHPRDGVIHPQIRNCGTVTRRPTGSSPNILQVSKGKTRSIFLPRYTGHVVISNDFSGQELRLTGSESRDPVLIDCYTGLGTRTDEDGMIHPIVRDVHSVTSCAFALDVLDRQLGKGYRDLILVNDKGFVDYDFFRKVYKNEIQKHGVIAELGDMTADITGVFEKVRGMAKVVNFLIIYGGNHMTLAKKLGITEEFAERLMDLVFKSYARLGPWQEETIAFAEEHGYVQTAYGTRRHVTDAIVSRDSQAKSRIERQAVNATIQGCAADILKEVLDACYRTKLFEETKAVLYAPVYDEIVASVPAHYAVEFTHRLQALMNVTPPGHPIPMMAEASIGRNWHEQEELGDNPSAKVIEACVERAFS